MAARDHDAHWQEIRTIHRDYKFFYQIGGGIVLVLLGIWIGSLLFRGDAGFATNIYTEVLSIAVTVGILNVFAKQREVNQLKQQLIRNAASTSNEIAKDAIHQLRRQEWLKGEKGILQKQNLEYANLSSALLSRANLSGAILQHANLHGTDLDMANLSGAILVLADLSNSRMQLTDLRKSVLTGANLTNVFLTDSDLREAKLHRAIMQRADLSDSDLSGAHLHHVDLSFATLSGANLAYAQFLLADLDFADLSFADLRGASLLHANLERAILREAQFDGETILPDGAYWTLDTDMRRFIDPSHSQFWEPPPPHRHLPRSWKSPLS